MASFFYDIGTSLLTTTISDLAVGVAVSYAGGVVVAGVYGLALLGHYSATSASKKLSDYTFTQAAVKAPKFTVNFTKKFQVRKEKQSLLPSAYNRDNVIQQVEDKLSIKDNSAVFLHGAAGTGKTAIFEQIVYRQVMGESLLFKEYQILKLQQNELYNLEKGLWTKMKEFALTNGVEADLSRLFDKIKNEKYILFIDEADTIINAQFFNKKLEELARGDVKLIFATTTEQMQACTARWGPAMRRRIPFIELQELSLSETIKALENGKEDYERIYGVKLEKDALKTIVALSNSSSEMFPHKAVHLLGEVCSGIKRGQQHNPKIDSLMVLKYYAEGKNKNIQRLQEEVKSLLDSVDPARLKGYFPQIAPHKPFFDNKISDALKQLRASFLSDRHMFLFESSKTIQQIILNHFANEKTIISVSLENMAKVYNELSPEGQQYFLKYYYDMINTKQSNQNLIFHIIDGENLGSLLAVKKPVDKISPVLEPIIPEAEMAERGLEQFNNILQQVGIPASIPNVFPSKNGGEKNSSETSLPASFFIDELMKDIKAQKIKVIATISNSVEIELDAGNADKFSMHTVEAMHIDQMIAILSSIYPSIDAQIRLQVLFCAFYFASSQNLLDKTCEVLDRIQREKSIAFSNILTQSFKGIVKDSILFESVAFQYELLDEIFYSLRQGLLKHSHSASSVIQKVVNELLHGNKKMNFLQVEDVHHAETLEKIINFLPAETFVHHFTIKALKDLNLDKSFLKKFIYHKLLALKEKIEAQNTKDGIFILDIPFDLQTPQIAALIELIINKHNLKGLHFCSKEAGLASKPDTPSGISRFIGHFLNQKTEKPSSGSQNLYKTSSQLIPIDCSDEKNHGEVSILHRIWGIVKQWIFHPIIYVGKLGQRALRIVLAPVWFVQSFGRNSGLWNFNT